MADSRQSHCRALGDACMALGIDHEAAPSVFHRLPCDLGRWAGLGCYRLWEAELRGAGDTTLTEVLAIRLTLHAAIAPNWASALCDLRQPVVPSRDLLIDAVEIASSRDLNGLIASGADTGTAETRGEARLAFCIDVRSERIRRALATVSPGLRTLGAAGFSGLTLAHKQAAPASADAR